MPNMALMDSCGTNSGYEPRSGSSRLRASIREQQVTSLDPGDAGGHEALRHVARVGWVARQRRPRARGQPPELW